MEHLHRVWERMHPGVPYDIERFLLRTEKSVDCVGRGRQERSWKTDIHDRFRIANNLPKRSSRKGMPPRAEYTQEEFDKLTPREFDLLNAVCLYQEQVHGDFEGVIVDVQSTLDRRAFKRNNELNTFSGNTSLWSFDLRRFLTSEEKFQLQGWPASRLQIPRCMHGSPGRVQSLIGNMMAVPCVGSVLATALSTFDIKSDLVNGRRL